MYQVLREMLAEAMLVVLASTALSRPADHCAEATSVGVVTTGGAIRFLADGERAMVVGFRRRGDVRRRAGRLDHVVGTREKNKGHWLTLQNFVAAGFCYICMVFALTCTEWEVTSACRSAMK